MIAAGGAHERACSFCKKPVAEVRKLVASADVSICDECVQLCVEILAAEAGAGSTVGAQAPAPLPAARVHEPVWRRWLRRTK